MYCKKLNKDWWKNKVIEKWGSDRFNIEIQNKSHVLTLAKLEASCVNLNWLQSFENLFIVIEIVIELQLLELE